MGFLRQLSIRDNIDKKDAAAMSILERGTHEYQI